MLRNQSFNTISEPEFIEITPYNDLISKCEIKVLYLGENRNRSYISKDVAKEMANTLPGTPIVAVYREEKEDFGDHGHVIIIEDNEISTSCKTVPYGFVAPDAKVWFQKFIDVDFFGNQIEREYLMTTGYLWTGQYPEVKKAIDEGLPQSMELNEEGLDGYWATNNNSGIDFFIINDAAFTKLCILGSDVEPCFEGASVTAPNISKEFTEDKCPGFVKKLLEMKKELNYALQNEGGSDMLKNQITDSSVEEKPVINFEEASGESGTDATGNASETTESEESTEDNVEDSTEEAEEVEDTSTDGSEESDSENSADEDKEETIIPADEEDFINTDVSSRKRPEFAKENEEDDEEENNEETSDEKEEEKEEKPENKHALNELQNKFSELAQQYAALEQQLEKANEELKTLRAFKLECDNKVKDEEIAKYYMLSDEDKADIISNKEKYSLSEIKAKLALLYVEKNVSFSEITDKVADEVVEENSSPITTFCLDAEPDMKFTNAPSWAQDILDNRK